MKFNSKHNDAAIVIEFDEQDASQSQGQVYQCEVLLNGQIVTPLVSDNYEGFLMECEQHFAAANKAERATCEYDRGQAQYEAVGCSL